MKRDTYLKILEAYDTPEHVKRHCMAVGDAAVNLCTALIHAGIKGIDKDAIEVAGYLHDIARAEKDHDRIGAGMLRDMDFSPYGGISEETREAAADIIARHMKLIFPDTLNAIDSAAVVSLADRVIKEDVFVGYEARMDDLLKRYADIPEVCERVHKNMGRAMSLISQIEQMTGKTLRKVISGGRVDAAPLFMHVERPGRYIGGELNCIRKDWNEAALRFCFAFPDLYEIGMSYTGMQIIYGLLNEQEDVLCERVFAPAADMEELFRKRALPLFSLENRMPIRNFDMVGFTLQYELCYTNVVRMLKQAEIPVYATERGESDPIIIAGGPCCANAEPVAPFFDLVCVGDGEEILPALTALYIAWKKDGASAVEAGFAAERCENPDGDVYEKKSTGIAASRERFLFLASKIPGVYAPAFYEPVYENTVRLRNGSYFSAFAYYEKRFADLPDRISRAVTKDLDAAFFPTRPLVAHIESVHDRIAVEIMRGCYRKCKFCQASYACDGVRRRSPERIKELIFEGLANTGDSEVSLLSLSTGDYPGIETLVTDLMDSLAKEDATLSLPSLRLDSLKADTLKKIAEYKRSGLTFAPEAGSQRLRDSIDKQITEDDLIRALDICLPIDFQKFKLYFMIGLPGETYEDLDGIIDLADKLVRHAKTVLSKNGQKYRFNLSVSVSNFVPKPGTPLERARGNSEEELMKKIHYLKDGIRRAKGVGFKYHDTRMSAIEMLLAKGDSRTADAVLRAAEKGCGFDSWREHFSYENWIAAFAEAGLPMEDLYAADISEIMADGGDSDSALCAEKEDIALPWSLIGPGKAYK